MDKQLVAKATPLVERKLADQRSENKKGIVKSILSLNDCPNTITPKNISRLTKKKYNIDLDQTESSVNTTAILELLVQDGTLKKNDDGTYDIINKPEAGDFDELLKPVWDEFSERIKSSHPDIDIHFANKTIKKCFEDFLEIYLEQLLDSSEELSEFSTDELYSIDLGRIINNSIGSRSLEHEEIYKSEIKKYFEDPGDELLKLVNKYYMTVINIDLLSKEESLDFDEMPGGSKILILDTNVLVALLCEKDRSHSLASAVCERSKEVGFKLVYTPDTRDELRRLIRGSKYEMDGFHSGPENIDAIRSQFVRNYYQRDDIGWEDYLSEISDWPRLLKLNWGISELDGVEETNKEVYDFAYDTLRQLERISEEDMDRANQNKIEHDARIISIAGAMRDDVDDNFKHGPYIITNHNNISTCGEIGKRKFWDERIVIQLRTWLNYLSTFTPSDISKSNENELAKAIIDVSKGPEKLDIENYPRIVAPKVGLEEKDEDVLADYFVNHPLSTKMEKALEDDRGDEAERLAKEMLEDEDRLDRFIEIRDNDEKVDELRSSLSEVREKWEIEREKREQLEEVVEKQKRIQVNLNVSATASASAESDIENFNNELNNFIELLDSRLPEGYEQSDLPEPPDDEAGMDEIASWLRDLKISIAASGSVAALEPFAGELLETATSFI